MPYITLSSGLTIKVPTRGTTNWDETLRTDTFQKISEHDHTGGGRGSQLGSGSIVDDGITDVKIRLRNNQYLRARDASNSTDINLIKVDSNDLVRISDFKGLGSFDMTNNQAVAANITGLFVDTSKSSRGAHIIYHVYRDGTSDLFESGILEVFYNGTDFDFNRRYWQGPAGITFSVTSGGQVQYTSTDNTGSASNFIYWTMITLGA